MVTLTKNKNHVKFILSTIYVIFMITAVTVIIIGSSIFNYNDIHQIRSFLLSFTIIVIGSLVLVVSLFALWTIYKESYCLNLISSILLTLLAIADIVVGSYNYILKSGTREYITDLMQDAMLNYIPNESNESTFFWDYLQRQFSCCGIHGYKDWLDLLNNQIPISCCFLSSGIVDNFSCIPEYDTPNLYTWGCLNYFNFYVEHQYYQLGSAGIASGIIMIVGILITFILGRIFKREIHNMEDQ
ncbi:CD63 antigen-like [Cochliomyia hominivorax]